MTSGKLKALANAIYSTVDLAINDMPYISSLRPAIDALEEAQDLCSILKDIAKELASKEEITFWHDLDQDELDDEEDDEEDDDLDDDDEDYWGGW